MSRVHKIFIKRGLIIKLAKINNKFIFMNKIYSKMFICSQAGFYIIFFSFFIEIAQAGQQREEDEKEA